MVADPSPSSKVDEKSVGEKGGEEKKGLSGQKRIRKRPTRSKKSKKDKEEEGVEKKEGEGEKNKPKNEQDSKVGQESVATKSTLKKRLKLNKKTKKSKKEAKEAKESGDFDPKIKLKAIIRHLPPNLPEQIFWQAVSPYILRSAELPKGGTAIQNKANDLVEPSSTAPFADQAYFVPGKLKDGSRRGLQGDNNVSAHTYSRAYIRFKTTDDLINFHRGFDGHLFRDSKGNEYIAIVEYAPFQRMPEDGVKRKKLDTLAGTIEEDEDYKQFVSLITQTEAKLAQEKGLGQLEKTDAQLMSHLSSLATDSQNSQNQAKSTPLLDHLRAQRLAKSEASALKQTRKQTNKDSTLVPSQKSTKKSKAKEGTDNSIPTGPKAMVQKQKDEHKSESGKKKNKKSEKLDDAVRIEKDADHHIKQSRKLSKKGISRAGMPEEESSGPGKLTATESVSPTTLSSSPKLAILKREKRNETAKQQNPSSTIQKKEEKADVRAEESAKQPRSRGRRGRGVGNAGDT